MSGPREPLARSHGAGPGLLSTPDDGRLMNPRMRIELVPPTESCRESFLRGLREFQREELPWWVGGGLETAEQDFAAFVALNNALRVEGGHIGYDTVPSFRCRGVATEMLRQALPVARALGLPSVLLTCDDTNAASIRVIERNGGSLREAKALDTNRPLKRYYWIPVS